VCLIDTKQVYLLQFSPVDLISSHSFAIDCPGSQEIMKAFFRTTAIPNWCKITRNLCEQYGVKAVKLGAFLGAGAHGS
jgi:hypothetical protein